MGGNTGNIRTQRNQSGTVGYRTLESILASAGDAGSVKRIYKWAYFNNVSAPIYVPRLEFNFNR